MVPGGRLYGNEINIIRSNGHSYEYEYHEGTPAGLVRRV